MVTPAAAVFRKARRSTPARRSGKCSRSGSWGRLVIGLLWLRVYGRTDDPARSNTRSTYAAALDRLPPCSDPAVDRDQRARGEDVLRRGEEADGGGELGGLGP